MAHSSDAETSARSAENDVPAVEWWITDQFFSNGGRKVMGPFVSRDLAIEVRTLRETVEDHASYFIDSTRVFPPGSTEGADQ